MLLSLLKKFIWRSSLVAVLLVGGWVSAQAATETAAPIMRQHASILMYHHVSERTPPSTSTSPDLLRQHLDLLEQEGFQVWPLERIVRHLQRRQPLPDKIAALTFDDGFISVYEAALPLLQERQLPFTIFVNANSVNGKHPLYMTWAQLQEAQQAGASIANHGLTHNHMIRKQEDETDAAWLARISHEIDANQAEIQRHLGSAPKILAYPYGEYNPDILRLVRQKGYVAFGQQSGPASFYMNLTALPRYAAAGTSAEVSSLRTKLLALPFPLVSEEPASPVLDGSERRPSLQLVLQAGDYRLNQLRCYGPDAQLLDVTTKQLPDTNWKIEVNSSKDLPAGRPRYNCTAPHTSENRYFWFTRQWLMPHADGSWYNF